MRHIIRTVITLGLLAEVWINAHWAVALTLSLLSVEAEISAFIFVRNIKGVYLEKR